MRILGDEKGAELRLYEPGEVLFHEGDISDELFIVRRGRLQVSRYQNDSQVNLAVLEEGSVVGELSIFDGQLRSANVRSVGQCAVLTIKRLAFERLINQLPEWVPKLFYKLAQRLRDSNSKVEQTLVKLPLLSFAFFLQRTLTGVQRPELSFLRKRFHTISRLGYEVIDNCIDELVAREFIALDGDTIKILDSEMFLVFLDLNTCRLRAKPYPLLELSQQGREWLILLNQFAQFNPGCACFTAVEWEKQMAKLSSNSGMQFIHTSDLRLMNVLRTVDGGKNWELNTSLTAALNKTLENLVRLEI